ncbi:hypothetical protein [Oleiharenicola lentus]|uniref:hypothetical protein n=1 Tax=Oleiharenicola lentus TaxID=2508720 RepID=UPI003F673367
MSNSRFILAAVLLVGLLAFGLDQLATHYGPKVAVCAFLAVNAMFMPKPSMTLGAHTTVANLWVPAIWIVGIAERVLTRVGLINSGIAIRDPQIVEAASGGGTAVEIPFFKEADMQDDIQVENGDLTIQNVTSGKQRAAILNRRLGFGATALSKGVSGADPLGFALDTVSDNRLRNRQRTLLHIMRGVFGFAAAPGAGAAAFKTLRRDIFSETGAAPSADKLFSSDEFLKTIGLLGELKDTMDDAVIVCHSDIETAMSLQEDVTIIRDSEGKKRVKDYKGSRVIVSDLLRRAGGVSGFVYDTYIFMPGAVAYGEKPQASEVGEISTFYPILDTSKNNKGFADYTRFIMHPQGAAWAGNPAGQSATNAELAVEANWTLAYADARGARIVCLRSNG